MQRPMVKFQEAETKQEIEVQSNESNDDVVIDVSKR